jgi:hypothetical protein
MKYEVWQRYEGPFNPHGEPPLRSNVEAKDAWDAAQKVASQACHFDDEFAYVVRDENGNWFEVEGTKRWDVDLLQSVSIDALKRPDR